MKSCFEFPPRIDVCTETDRAGHDHDDIHLLSIVGLVVQRQLMMRWKMKTRQFWLDGIITVVVIIVMGIIIIIFQYSADNDE